MNESLLWSYYKCKDPGQVGALFYGSRNPGRLRCLQRYQLHRNEPGLDPSAQIAPKCGSAPSLCKSASTANTSRRGQAEGALLQLKVFALGLCSIH